MARVASMMLVLLACSSPPKHRTTPGEEADDPDGPHRAAVEAQLRPLVAQDIVRAMVVGLYSGGKSEIYGFGVGPGGKAPTGRTLFEIGSITKVYTSLLLADAVQRRELDFEAPLAELLPAGVTVPTLEKRPITLKLLALHSSGLPRLPPSIAAREVADPYAIYTEDQLYRDLIATRLESPPGTQIVYSNFGAGVLGFALGRKIGGGYGKAVASRVLSPLGLRDTFFAVPPKEAARFAAGTDSELAAAPHWTFADPMAGAGGMVSSVRDQLKLIDAELDAAAGGKGPLRGAMRFTQESQLANVGANEGLGWQIDSEGRHWHNGGTAGFRSFIAFDIKQRRGVVVLAATSTTLVDLVGGAMFAVLDDAAKAPSFPDPARLQTYTGTYDFGPAKLVVKVDGKRLYVEAPNEPRRRMVPMGGDKFWIEALQSTCLFQFEDGKVKQLVFDLNGQLIAAPKSG